MALLQGSIVFLIRSPTICSNLALDSFKFMLGARGVHGKVGEVNVGLSR